MIIQCTKPGCNEEFEQIKRSRRCEKHRTSQKEIDKRIATRKERRELGLENINKFNNPAFEMYRYLLTVKKEMEN